MAATALPKNERTIFFSPLFACENLACNIFMDIHKGFFYKSLFRSNTVSMKLETEFYPRFLKKHLNRSE
jgi:hypothetical protein